MCNKRILYELRNHIYNTRNSVSFNLNDSSSHEFRASSISCISRFSLQQLSLCEDFAPYLIHQKVSVLKSKTIDLSTENFNKEILKQGDFNISKNVIPQAVSLLVQLVWHHPFSKYVKCSKKLTFLTPWSVRNGGKRWGFFSENLAYLLNGWSLSTDVLTGDSDLFDT